MEFFFGRLFFVLFIALSFANASSDLQDRIEYHSRQLLGNRYGESPLGEGQGFDSDPLIKYDLFDCTTYVETVLALSYSDLVGVNRTPVEILNSIRYKSNKSEISFVNRAHFTSADWIPNLVAKQIIEDITLETFKSMAYIERTEIDRQSWFMQNFKMQVLLPTQVVELPVVTLSEFTKNPKLWDRIPSGSLINFVGHAKNIKEKSGTDMDVTHQGIAIRRDGTLYLRHAKSHGRGVIEEPIADAYKHPYLIHAKSINILRPLSLTR